MKQEVGMFSVGYFCLSRPRHRRDVLKYTRILEQRPKGFSLAPYGIKYI